MGQRAGDLCLAAVEVPEVAVVARAVGDGLRGVNRGAAAHRQHEVHAVFLAQADALIHQVAAGIGLHAAQLEVPDARSVQRGDHLREQAAAHDAAAAVDNQRAAAAKFTDELANLVLAVPAEDKLCGGTEFKIQHRCSSSISKGRIRAVRFRKRRAFSAPPDRHMIHGPTGKINKNLLNWEETEEEDRHVTRMIMIRAAVA